MDLKNTKFQNSKILDCDFFNSNLENSSFENSTLTGTKFENTNLSHSSFVNTKDYLIDPNKNNIKKAKFSFPDAVSLLNVFDIEIV